MYKIFSRQYQKMIFSTLILSTCIGIWHNSLIFVDNNWVCFDCQWTRFSFIVSDDKTTPLLPPHTHTHKSKEYWNQPVKNKLAAILMFCNLWQCYTWCFLCIAVKYLFSVFCMDPSGNRIVLWFLSKFYLCTAVIYCGS